MSSEIPLPSQTDDNNRISGLDVHMMTEFWFSGIKPGNNFRGQLLQRCRINNIGGFIVYNNEGRALGKMYGKRKDLNELKDWIWNGCIPIPFCKRATFSKNALCTEAVIPPFQERFISKTLKEYFDNDSE
ncbi:uncharacterized protein LOC108091216 [Drosophila ficusphila]|uniref:uncharacterized protein LOC108091216 n=1 Tax=Drosophila ficusphila TaxID=30025 RepID=UPI0007E83D5D|nr:uncharacterized protein LOC108091216 [Drosophila ficusphila]